MLQRWLLFLLAAEAVLYFGLLRWLSADGRTPVFIAVVLFLLIFCWRGSHALSSFLVTELLRIKEHHTRPGRASLRALWGEFTSRMVSYNWSQPFHQWALSPDPVGRRDGTPILLVHGYFSNRGMWVSMRRRLTAAGLGPVYTVTLEPLMGTMDEMVPVLAKRVEEILRETGKDRLAIVAHSMGGLVARAYLVGEGRGRIIRLVTLGSPHHGTVNARFGLGSCTTQMRLGSHWLESLDDREAAEKNKPPTLSIYTLDDDIVYPPETSCLYWAENVVLSEVGHVGLLFSKPVAERVIAALR